ncbi:hypothetical protein LXM60_07105 [Pandoraea sputorum]|uniref:hypothetical protein n=1 Tax=Pandoraea sputorum TaxID=93222 RepID=UPI001E336017|nr:hypothetical protein [Pandoraea sputorum]MCE4059972.1 hypothetical protein [Pandoraea sputorum]
MSKNFRVIRESLERAASTRRVITLVSIVAIPVMFATRPNPNQALPLVEGGWIEHILTALHSDQPILFNVAIGYLISAFFWWIVVDIPERRRREIIRNSLARCYFDFKESVVSLMLGAADGTISSNQVSLLASNHREFRAYFKENESRRLYDFVNAISGTLLSDLRLEFEKLRAEVGYVLANVQIDDKSVHDGLKRIQNVAFMLNNWSGYQDDPAKYLGREIWGLLARFSFADGYVDDDFIETLIARIK